MIQKNKHLSTLPRISSATKKKSTILCATVFFGVLSACSDSGSSSSSTSGGASGDGITTPALVQGEVYRDIGLVINELMTNIQLSDSLVNKSDFEWRRPWLEIHNSTDESINLEGFKLTSRGIENKSWEFPDIAIEGGAFLRVWGTGFDRKARRNELHTSFPIMGAEALTLVHRDSSVLDRVEAISVPQDESWGRSPDGARTYGYFASPTPGRANVTPANSFSLNCNDMTLTAGTKYPLKTSPSVPVTWRSNSAAVRVSDKGVISSTTNGASGQQRPALITATDTEGLVRDCQVTVVNWTSNVSSLVVMGNPRADFLLSYMDDHIYYTVPRELFRAEDGFKNDRKVGSFPYATGAPVMFKTSSGYFASSGPDIYSTSDFNTWTPELKMQHVPLQHGFSYHFDENSSTNYLYAGEYSVDSNAPHAVYRGVNTGANTRWEKALDWESEQTFYDDNSNLDTIRHVHAVVTDPYTGHVWVATGDVDQHSRLYFSDDNGLNFN